MTGSQPPPLTPIAVPDSYLLYDGECPVCTRYVAWTALRDIRPDIVLINARQSPDLVAALRLEAININDTMVLKLGPLQLTGHQALLAIRQLNRQRPGFAGLLLRLLGHPRLAPRLYPVLAAGRKLLLAVMGRTRIP